MRRKKIGVILGICVLIGITIIASVEIRGRLLRKNDDADKTETVVEKKLLTVNQLREHYGDLFKDIPDDYLSEYIYWHQLTSASFETKSLGGRIVGSYNDGVVLDANFIFIAEQKENLEPNEDFAKDANRIIVEIHEPTGFEDMHTYSCCIVDFTRMKKYTDDSTVHNLDYTQCEDVTDITEDEKEQIILGLEKAMSNLDRYSYEGTGIDTEGGVKEEITADYYWYITIEDKNRTIKRFCCSGDDRDKQAYIYNFLKNDLGCKVDFEYYR